MKKTLQKNALLIVPLIFAACGGSKSNPSPSSPIVLVSDGSNVNSPSSTVAPHLLSPNETRVRHKDEITLVVKDADLILSFLNRMPKNEVVFQGGAKEAAEYRGREDFDSYCKLAIITGAERHYQNGDEIKLKLSFTEGHYTFVGEDQKLSTNIFGCKKAAGSGVWTYGELARVFGESAELRYDEAILSQKHRRVELDPVHDVRVKKYQKILMTVKDWSSVQRAMSDPEASEHQAFFILGKAYYFRNYRGENYCRLDLSDSHHLEPIPGEQLKISLSPPDSYSRDELKGTFMLGSHSVRFSCELRDGTAVWKFRQLAEIFGGIATLSPIEESAISNRN